jgi:hypothetical protein
MPVRDPYAITVASVVAGAILPRLEQAYLPGYRRLIQINATPCAWWSYAGFE